MKTELDQVAPYQTKDGSLIRELMHPSRHGNAAQSLAHATIDVGAGTRRHYHRSSEELYHVLAGEGAIRLDHETLALKTGDTILIRPGTPHSLRNTGNEPLQLLCCCSPPYTHEDTVVITDEDDWVSRS